eukprot:GFKZ01009523.1.p1 GENE.GFKZ01009523.1~~GFKZ01009523.1.p1  ORF type:complete len:316 (+),score=64.97 GFKZ01009523.1:201-1148(+)
MQPSPADVIAPDPTDLPIPEVHEPIQSASPVAPDSKVEVNCVALGVDSKDLALAKSGRKQVSLSDKKDALRLLGARNDGTFGAAQLQPETNKKWSNKAVADRYGVSKATVTGWKNASRKIMRADTGHGRVGKKVRMRDSPFASLEAALHASLKDDHCGSSHDEVKMDAVRTRAREIRDEMVGRLKIQMRIVNDEKKRNEMRKEIQVLEGFRTSAGWTQKFIERHKYFRMREMDQEEEEEQERKEREENEREVKEKLGQLKKYQDAAVGFRVEICALMGDRSMISDAKAHTLLASVDMELERVAKLLDRAHQRGRL